MLELVGTADVDVIVAWHIDRLVRRLADLEPLIQLTTDTATRVATVTGDLDLSNDAGRLVGRILASVAQGEVERKGARQSRAQQQAAQEGRPSGGRRPFGYGVPRRHDGRLVWDVTEINQPEAELVRGAYQTVIEGGSLRGIASDWNGREISTTMGNRWIHSTVRRLLLNPRNAARRTYKGEVVGPASWPAIIDDDTFDAVHAILVMPDRNTTTGRARKWLLPGLAKCHCGSDVMTGWTRHGKRTYRCRAMRGHLARAADPIDDYVSAIVVERLSRPDAVDLLDGRVGPDLADFRAKAQAIRDRLDDLATALEEGVLTLPAVRRSSDRLKQELVDVEARIAALSAVDVLAPLIDAPDVEKAWVALDLERRRAVIDTLMVITLLSPGRGRQPFDPQKIQIEPRKPS